MVHHYPIIPMKFAIGRGVARQTHPFSHIDSESPTISVFELDPDVFSG